VSLQSPERQPSPSTPIVHQFFDPFELPDPATSLGQSLTHRLQTELLIWLTTVDEKGVPQPLPVTFLWDSNQSNFLTYSRTDRGRLAHVEHNPNVSLHFDEGHGDIIIITGEAQLSPNDPPSDQIPAWVEKYREMLARLGVTPQQSAASATTPLRIRPLTLRYSRNPK
jgi:PPOX class probable F420-dependent enzyme